MDHASTPVDGLISAAPHAVVVSDEGGRIVQVNTAAERLLGYGHGELIGLSIEALVPADARQAHARMREAFDPAGMRQAHDTTRRLEAVRKDGSRIAVVIGIAPWHTAGEVRHVAFILDDEARRLAEREAGERHRSAIEAGELSQAIIGEAALGILLYDAGTGQCVAANRAATAITGVAHEALLRQNFREIASWKSSGLLAAAERAIAGRQTVSCEIEMVSSAGKALLLHCECLVISRRERPHLVLMLNDLSERRNLEAQLRAAQKMEAVGQLAGGVAHDFNNLLTVIGTYSSLMLEDCKPDDPRRDDLEEIVSAANRAATLTRQLLAFGRRQLLDAKLIDLNAVVVGLEKMLSRVLPAEIEFSLDLAPDLAAIVADEGQVEQVIMNLVVNARDAMPSGGTLSIETRNGAMGVSSGSHEAVTGDRAGTGDGPAVIVRVTDSGCGMSAATLARIFEPFFTTKEVGRGTGLGLSTAYGIVRQSGGTIHVRSTPGVGTSFEVAFPRAGGAALKPAAPEGRALEAPQHGFIIVAEDDEHVRRIVVKALSDRGYSVAAARDGAEAIELALARSTPPDLLVTDVVMPRVGGREVARRLRERWPGLPVLFTSAYAADEGGTGAVAELQGQVLRKPFIPVELTAAVYRAIHGAND